MSDTLPEALEDAGPFVGWVYKEIDYAEGKPTVLELCEATGRRPRAIRRATTELEERGLVESKWLHEERQRRAFETPDP